MAIKRLMWCLKRGAIVVYMLLKEAKVQRKSLMWIKRKNLTLTMKKKSKKLKSRIQDQKPKKRSNIMRPRNDK